MADVLNTSTDSIELLDEDGNVISGKFSHFLSPTFSVLSSAFLPRQFLRISTNNGNVFLHNSVSFSHRGVCDMVIDLDR